MSAWKKLWLEHLREEDAHAILGELAEVGAEGAQALHVTDDDAVDALRDQHIDAAVIPVHLGHVQQVRAGEVALQLRGIRRLAHQIQLIEHGLLVLGDHFQRPHPPALRPSTSGPGAPARRTAPGRVRSARARSGRSTLTMTSCPPGRVAACTWAIEAAASGVSSNCANTSLKRPTVGAFETRAGHGAGEWRHPVLQFREFIGDIRRQQVAARRDRLAELHENRPQLDQRQAQIFPARTGAASRHARRRGRAAAAGAAAGTDAWRAPVRPGDGAAAPAGCAPGAQTPAASRRGAFAVVARGAPGAPRSDPRHRAARRPRPAAGGLRPSAPGRGVHGRGTRRGW